MGGSVGVEFIIISGKPQACGRPAAVAAPTSCLVFINTVIASEVFMERPGGAINTKYWEIGEGSRHSE